MTRTKFLYCFCITLFFHSYSFSQAKDSINNELIFISDTQTPLGVEKIAHHKTQQNSIATKNILHHIANLPIQNIFMLGDVVGLGFKNKSWQIIDSFLLQAQSKQKNVYAILGNHDVMLKPKKGVSNFEKRFANQSKTGYVVVKDSIAIVMLNSNFSKLSKKENEQQLNWYTAILSTLDTRASVKSIIVCCHHSPYSNSKVVGCNTNVQNKFVFPFNNSTKCKLFLSGHSHNFEHFVVNNKNFCVIGGGGGIHQTIKKNTALQNLSNNYKPLFHYLSIKRENNKLYLTSYWFNNKQNTISNGYCFDIDL